MCSSRSLHTTFFVACPTVRHKHVDVRVASAAELSSGVPLDTGGGANKPPSLTKRTGGDGGQESDDAGVDEALSQVTRQASEEWSVANAGISALWQGFWFRINDAGFMITVKFVPDRSAGFLALDVIVTDFWSGVNRRASKPATCQRICR